MKSHLKLIVSFLVVVGFTVAAKANLLSFDYSGQVSAIHDDLAGTFSSNFAVGNSINGTFTIDTNATGSLLISPYLKSYPISFTADINGHDFYGAAEYRIFNNGPGGDGFSIINEHRDYVAPVLGNLVPRTFFIQFLGMPTTALTDLSLITDPVSLVPLANPSYAPNGLRLDNKANPDDYGALYFTVNSVRAVPDTASTIALLGISFLGLGLIRHRMVV